MTQQIMTPFDDSGLKSCWDDNEIVAAHELNIFIVASTKGLHMVIIPFLNSFQELFVFALFFLNDFKMQWALVNFVLWGWNKMLFTRFLGLAGR